MFLAEHAFPQVTAPIRVPQRNNSCGSPVYRALTLDMADAVLIEEARSQAVALHGPEFAERYAAWRSQITGGGSR
jgi:hypothetical protein